MAVPNNTCDTLTFYPTMRQMKNFDVYYSFLLSQGAHRGGIAKIVPPAEWIPRSGGYEDVMKWKVGRYTLEKLEGSDGVFTKNCRQKRTTMSIESFQYFAWNPQNLVRFRSFDDADKLFWDRCCNKEVRYADALEGSLFDKSQKRFNLSKLKTPLDLQPEVYDMQYPGVTTPFIYVGMFGSSFAWHTEDFDLPSINYIHFGAPKIWYSVPPEQGHKFKELMRELFPEEADKCPEFIRHKKAHVHPQVLMERGIKVNRLQQNRGEFIVTFPFGHHQGFNAGFNCAEAINFAHESWIDHGMVAEFCKCGRDVVKIDVALFLECYRPDKVGRWNHRLNDAELEVDYTFCPEVPDFRAAPALHWRARAQRFLYRKNQEREEMGLPPLRSLRKLGSWIEQMYEGRFRRISALPTSSSSAGSSTSASSSSSSSEEEEEEEGSETSDHLNKQ